MKPWYAEKDDEYKARPSWPHSRLYEFDQYDLEKTRRTTRDFRQPEYRHVYKAPPR